MRVLLLAATLFMFTTSHAQYYYKDILGTRETADLIKSYRDNKVSRVVLTSYDAENMKTDDFFVNQLFTPSTQMLRTVTRSAYSTESVLTSWLDANGHVIKTIDSTDAVVTTTNYRYDGSGNLLSASTISIDSFNTANESEEHLWQYRDNKPYRMLRIKNRIDTTIVDLVSDENGNIIEERSTRKGIKSEPIYYYYDADNRLTDIVRFNRKANRLLPEFLFEYSPTNQVIQKITVPSNSDNYLIWRYRYDERGLKVKEAIYNKRKELTGTIEYQYSFGG